MNNFDNIPQLQKEIAEIKNSETSLEERREKIKNLRAEIILNNAAIIKFVEETFLEHPDIDYDLLITLIKANFKLYFEESNLAEAVKEVFKQRNKMKRIYSMLEQRAREKNHSFEDEMKDYLNRGKSNKLKSKIEVIKNPLAPIIIIKDREDAKRFNGNENIPGGFFRKRHYIVGENNTNYYINLIVIFDFENKNIRDYEPIIVHENQHLINSNLSNTLDSLSDKKSWSESTNIHDYNWDKILIKVKYLRLKSKIQNERSLKQSEQYKFILEFALQRAKDEILAEMDMKTDWKIAHLNGNLIGAITNENAKHYKYFEEMGIHKDSKLFKMISEDYLQELNKNGIEAFRIFNFYKNFNIPNRAQNIKYVFAQWPISTWNKNIEKYGFQDEIESLKKLDLTIVELSNSKSITIAQAYDYYDRMLSYRLNDQPNRLLTDEINKIINKVVEIINDNRITKLTLLPQNQTPDFPSSAH